MSEQNDEQHFVERTRALLEQSAGRLDAATMQRLAAARRAALHGAARAPLRPGWMLPAGGLAVAASALIVVVALKFGGVAPANSELAGIEDIELLAAQEAPEFFYEDVEFYAWLDDEAEAS